MRTEGHNAKRPLISQRPFQFHAFGFEANDLSVEATAPWTVVRIGTIDAVEAMGAEAEAQRTSFAQKAGHMVALAAETFNDGLRAYYFSFAALGWFFSPVAFMLGTAGVIWILHQREFRSDVLAVLNS